MNKEQKAQTSQLIEQQLKIEHYELKANKALLAYYTKARKAVLADINRSIKRNLNYPSRARLQSLLKEIDSKIKTVTAKMTPLAAKAIGEAGAFSYADTNRIVSWEKKVADFDYVMMSPSQIAALVTEETLGGHTLGYWLWDALNAENKALKAEVNAARIRGIGYKKIMQELGTRYDNLLTAKGNEQNIETVVKSYIQAMNAKSHKDIYEANSSVMNGVEWSAVMENGNTSTGRGTCPRCAALDGQEYETVAKGPPCPLHPRCRCMYLPVTKTWEELGLDIEEMEPIYQKWYIRSPGRKIMSKGTIDGDYEKWWWGQSPTFQNNAIGKVRANLVRNKALDFKDIVYKNGNLIPLSKLDVTEKALNLARAR